MKTFLEFVDKKTRQAKKELKIISEILSANGLQVKNHLNDIKPYIFVSNPNQSTFFEGIRIYKIGSSIAFRVQNMENTEPYGKSYPLNVEEMYVDLLSDVKNELKAGRKLMKALVEEVNGFFKKSEEAEKDIHNDPRGSGNMVVSNDVAL